MVFHWSLSDSKSSQISRTRLRILAFLNNAVVWIVSTRPPTSKSPRPFNNPLVIVPNAPITIGTIVTFMFHSFFDSLARSRYLSFFSLSFRFILWSAGTAKSTILQILLFLLIIMRSGLLAGIRWSVCMLMSHRSLCESFLGQVLGCAYTICLYGRIEIYCTFPSRPPCRPSRVPPYTPSVLICCIRLLCDWSFRLCHRIAYIYCFVASYLSSLWYYYYYYYYFTPCKFFSPALTSGLSLESVW